MISPKDFCVYNKSEGERNRKPIIDEVVLDDFLAQQGYRCIYSDFSLRDIRPARIVDNILDETNSNEIYHYVRSLVREHSVQHLLPLKRYKDLLFQPSIIQMSRFIPEFLKDTHNECYIPFRNGIVVIDKNGYRISEYGKVLTGSKCISRAKIINKDVSFADYKKGSWYKFCERAAGSDGIEYLMRIIGYLIHNYKDKSVPKMVIFYDSDNVSSSGAMGSTGKSMVAHQAINEIRSLHYEDGKEFDTTGKFKFQGLNSGHDVICIDDIPEQFRLQVLYNKTTGNFQSEEKFKARRTIEYSDSPKTVITSNYGIILEGDSDKRRVEVFGFTGHYNLKTTPRSEFGHSFFTQWNGDRAYEYDMFFSFMFECVRLYLEEGMESYRHDNFIERGIMESIDSSLIERIDFVKNQLIGVENAKKISEWQSLIGSNKKDDIDSLKKYMESYGYKTVRTTKRVGGCVSSVYYFDI